MRAARFLFSGGVNTVISYFAFLITFWLSESTILSLLTGMSIGTISSYLLNKHWIWKQVRSNSFAKFLLVQVCLLTLNWMVLHLISLTNFPRELAQVFIYALFAILSFQIYSRFVFPQD